MKFQVIQFVMLLCSSFLLLPFFHATAEGEELNYTGTYSGEDGYSIVDVPFTLSSPAVTNIYYGAACQDVKNARLYLRPGDLAIPYDQAQIEWYSIALSRDEEPLEGYPLSKGDYIARIRCWGNLDSDAPDWTLSVKTNPIISTSVPEDPEPASMVVTTPTYSTSFSGWLGLWGIPDDPNVTGVNRLGHDLSDYKYYSLKKGTRIKFRAVWDSYTPSSDAPSYDMRVRIELYRNGQTYFVTDFDLLKKSGDETREITLLEDGVYRITAVDSSYLGTNNDPKEYRTYTIDVLLNGEELPNVKIGGINKVLTRYKPLESDNFATIEKLVPGNDSLIDISITNYGSKSIATTLAYGLSEDIKGPTKFVGATKLNLTPNHTSNIYSTWLKTPSDFKGITKVYLVAVLYGSANEVLDTYTTKVDVWSQNKAVAMTFLSVLLLNSNDK